MATSAFEQHELSRFLAGRRVAGMPGSAATMTGMGDKKGKWIISDEDYPKFLELLHDYLFVKRGRTMAFVEQPQKGKPKPLLVDLDFRYSAETSLTRTFTLEQIRSFCQMMVDGLRTFFGVTDFEELRFFVTLRPAPYAAAGVRKDGIHIMCPDVALADEKLKVLRNWMLSQDAIGKCFGGTGYVNRPDDIYDESMVRKQGWIFYGDSKPTLNPYLLASVFRYVPETEEWEDEPPDVYQSKDLMRLLSVRYGVRPDETVVLEEARDLYDSLKETTVVDSPYQGAVDGEDPPPMDTTVAAGQVNAIVEAATALGLMPTEASSDDRRMTRRLVMECLNDEYYEKYDKWIRVGWCLHNIEPSEENFQLWMDFSARSPKCTGNNVSQLRRDWFHGWRKTDDGPRLTERSLRKWAKDANPEKFQEIIEEHIGEYIRQEVEPDHYHIAKLMRKMYGSNYIASVGAKYTDWYWYDENMNMWKKLNQGIELRMKISSEVGHAIAKARGRFFLDRAKAQEEMGKVGGDKEKEAQFKARNNFIQDKLDELMKVEKSLYNNGFGDSVMKMAVHQFYEADFQNKLNVNPYLFGCLNGVLDLRVPGVDGRDHVVFRQGRPEDYVSFLAGQNQPEMGPINYLPYDPKDPLQAEIADFFSKLFPDPEVRRYTLRLLASCLEGTNKEQCFYIATGVGGNGKSKLVELMKLTFGDYQTSLQATALTRKRPDAGAANPEIMAIKGRRFICMQEPDDREPINTSRMKQFSGEDMVEARALYGDQEKFVVMGKLFMMCNRLPPVTTMDRGTWRRIRVLEFPSKFVPPDHPELMSGRPNVYLMDTSLDKKLRTWREAFLGLLVHIYEKEYIPFGLNPVPAAVMKASDKYKESHDVFARWRGERIRQPITMEEKIACRDEPITTNKIKSMLNAWKKDARAELDWQTTINRLTEEFGEPLNGKEWPTIKVFSTDEEVAEWDKEHAAT